MTALSLAQRSPGNVSRSRHAYRNVTPGLKWCPKCRTNKSVSEFGAAVDREDGLNASRNECNGRYWQDVAHARAMHAAHMAVRRAVVSGRLIKPTSCPICSAARRIEAHHPRGYDKSHQLDVIWCCRQCHVLEHKRGLLVAAQAA